MSGKDEKALVPMREKYVALRSPERVAELIKTNLGGRNLSIFDLERIRVPSGKPAGTKYLWQITDSAGGGEFKEEITCLIPYYRIDRTYWKKAYGDGAKGPPDCSSLDLANQKRDIGIGDNGQGMGEHRCVMCPQNKFGTAAKGAGKACREINLLFVMREGREKSLFPSVVSVTPGSMKAWRAYCQGLVDQHQIFYYEGIHRLELKVEKSGGDIVYAQLKPTLVRVLTEEERKAIEPYRKTVEVSFRTVSVEADDVLGGDGEKPAAPQEPSTAGAATK